jgi:hypothetical protein
MYALSSKQLIFILLQPSCIRAPDVARFYHTASSGMHRNQISRETLIKSTDIQLMRYSRDPNQTRDKQHEANAPINGKQRI